MRRSVLVSFLAFVFVCGCSDDEDALDPMSVCVPPPTHQDCSVELDTLNFPSGRVQIATEDDIRFFCEIECRQIVGGILIQNINLKDVSFLRPYDLSSLVVSVADSELLSLNGMQGKESIAGLSLDNVTGIRHVDELSEATSIGDITIHETSIESVEGLRSLRDANGITIWRSQLRGEVGFKSLTQAGDIILQELPQVTRVDLSTLDTVRTLGLSSMMRLDDVEFPNADWVEQVKITQTRIPECEITEWLDGLSSAPRMVTIEDNASCN